MGLKGWLREILQDNLVRFGYRLTQAPQKAIREVPDANLNISLEYIVYHYLGQAKPKRFNIIQIGAFDGISLNDAIYPLMAEPNFKAIMVEPQPDIFATLKKNYSSYENIAFENCAIDSVEHVRSLFTVAPNAPDCPRWLRACASFDQSIFQKYISHYPKIYDYLERVEVPCITLESLLSKHKLHHIDLLQIDVEGYDFEIIKTIDFDKTAPVIIRYEKSHLSKSDAEASYNMLIDAGYKIAIDGIDTLAYRVPSRMH